MYIEFNTTINNYCGTTRELEGVYKLSGKFHMSYTCAVLNTPSKHPGWDYTVCVVKVFCGAQERHSHTCL